MDKIYKYAQHFTKLEFMKAHLEVFQNESANKGIEFIVKNKLGIYHEIYLQPINLEKDRSVKIPKSELGELKDSLLDCIDFINERNRTGFIFYSLYDFQKS